MAPSPSTPVVTVSISSSLLASGANDLVVIGQLKLAGIPADYIRNGVVVLKGEGTITKAVQGKETIFTYTPVGTPVDPRDAQITDLKSKLDSASDLVTSLQSRATSAENLNDALKHQVTSSTAQIADLQKKIGNAEASLQASQTAQAAQATASSATETAPAPSTPETPAS